MGSLLFLLLSSSEQERGRLACVLEPLEELALPVTAVAATTDGAEDFTHVLASIVTRIQWTAAETTFHLFRRIVHAISLRNRAGIFVRNGLDPVRHRKRIMKPVLTDLPNPFLRRSRRASRKSASSFGFGEPSTHFHLSAQNAAATSQRDRAGHLDKVYAASGDGCAITWNTGRKTCSVEAGALFFDPSKRCGEGEMTKRKSAKATSAASADSQSRELQEQQWLKGCLSAAYVLDTVGMLHPEKKAKLDSLVFPDQPSWDQAIENEYGINRTFVRSSARRSAHRSTACFYFAGNRLARHRRAPDIPAGVTPAHLISSNQRLHPGWTSRCGSLPIGRRFRHNEWLGKVRV